MQCQLGLIQGDGQSDVRWDWRLLYSEVQIYDGSNAANLSNISESSGGISTFFVEDAMHVELLQDASESLRHLTGGAYDTWRERPFASPHIMSKLHPSFLTNVAFPSRSGQPPPYPPFPPCLVPHWPAYLNEEVIIGICRKM